MTTHETTPTLNDAMHTLEEIKQRRDEQGVALRLRPALPSHNRRYGAPLSPLETIYPAVVIPAQTQIDALSEKTLAGSNRLPAGWSENTTPEGDTYFRLASQGLVTPSDIRQPKLLAIVAQGYSEIQRLAAARDIPTTEVFVNVVPQSEDNVELEYYLIDKARRHPYWVEPVNTSQLGLQPYDTLGSLKSSLVAEFWTHMDYFAAHQSFDAQAEIELIGILRFYCVDDMTSPGSTSPYSAQECRQYLKLLEGFRVEGDVNAYRIATIARLWASIARVRHINAYGLAFPRLDRLQGLSQYSFSHMRQSRKLGLGEALTFNRSRRIFNRLTSLWNGRVVYQRHWHAFFEEMHAEWLRVSCLSLVILLCDVVLIGSRPITLTVVASVSFAGAAIAFALFLHQTHQRARLATAPDISAWIMRVEDLFHGLRPLSLSFTVPHALTVYSGVCLFAALVTWSLETAKDSREAMITTGIWCLPFSAAFFLATVF